MSACKYLSLLNFYYPGMLGESVLDNSLFGQGEMKACWLSESQQSGR